MNTHTNQHTIADSHVVLADLANRSHRGLTAFSALPNAPVLPITPPRTSSIARMRIAIGGLRSHRRRPLPRPAVAAGAGPAC